jgi:hypothetical protein
MNESPFEIYEEKFIKNISSLLEDERNTKLQRKKNIDRAVEIQKCKTVGKEIYECPIGCEECLPSEVVFCTKGHHVCKSCIKDSLKSLMSRGDAKAMCVMSGCKGIYPFNVVEKVLDEEDRATFSKISFDSDIQLWGGEMVVCIFDIFLWIFYF